MRMIPILAALTGLIATSPAMARDPVFVQSAPVKDQPAVRLDPAKGYILVDSHGPLQLMLMKIPSAEDRVAYTALRAERLATLQRRYERAAKAYPAQFEAWRKDRSQLRGDRPAMPIAPTDETLDTPPFEQMTAVEFGPLNRFGRVSGANGAISTYLQSITPGRYRLYGPVSSIPNGSVGICYCMGSIGFEVKAGEVVNLGIAGSETFVYDATQTAEDSFSRQPPIFVARTESMQVDARLKDAPIVPATFFPVGKLPNFYGVLVSRVAPMPGVIAYQRDRIIDLTQRP